MTDSGQKVCDVERDVIEAFLRLFRDGYKKADMANFFLELKHGVSGISIGITNQRDALSHFVSVLNHPEWTHEEKMRQLSNAEEHLRRAMIEPYERAVSLRLEEVLSLIDRYKHEVIATTTTPTANILSVADLKSRLNAITELRKSGRSTKALNQWSGEWETGVADLIQAYNQLTDLEGQLEQALLNSTSVRKRPRSSLPILVYVILGVLLGLSVALLLPR